MNGYPSADVVVVGGGLVGSSAAYEIACSGVDVTLVDAAYPGCASQAGAGIASPETLNDPDETWFAFALEAARHTRTLVARLTGDGVDPGPTAFSECGSMVLAMAEHEDRWFAEALELASARSDAVREISESEARAMFPPLGPFWRAMHNVAAARIDGRRLTEAIREAAVKHGTSIRNEAVIGIESSGEKVTAVRLERGVVRCGSLVIAAGAWSAGLSEQLGMRLPIRPMKGQIVHLCAPAGSSQFGAAASGSWPIVQPLFNFYLVPWPDGRIACGGTFEEAGFDTSSTAAGMRDLLRECVSIAPSLAEARFLEVRVGLRPMSDDERPLLGRLPGWDNVHVCSGHGANGLLLGPYSAALVASGLRGDTPEQLLAYGVERFSGG